MISGLGSAVVLVSKKGTVTVKIKRAAQTKQKENQEDDRLASEVILAHNRKKRYVLEEGKPVEFLVDLVSLLKKEDVRAERCVMISSVRSTVFWSLSKTFCRIWIRGGRRPSLILAVESRI